MTARQKLFVWTVFLVVVLLYVGVFVAGAGPGRDGAGTDGHSGFIDWLGDAAGEPPPAPRDDLHADCLTGQTLTVRGMCVLVVAGSDRGLREVRLHARDAVTISTRPPRRDTVVRDIAKPGDDVRVTVDGTGTDIALDCGEPASTCVLTLG